jgi:DNA-binding beta-propeller fold protein YncE
MIRPEQTIATVAGTGDPGYAGDGGVATSALLDTPEGLAFDHEGNLYIADTVNDRVRVVNVAGVIATAAGDGQPADGGDGRRGTLASLHLAAGPVYSAGQALAVDDAGDLFIADALNSRIRMVDVAGTITTVAGTGRVGESGDGSRAAEAELNVPLGVAVGEDSRLYVADSSNNRILLVR